MRPANSVVIFAIAILLLALAVAFALDTPTPTQPPSPANVELTTNLQQPLPPPQPLTHEDGHLALETPQRIAESIQPPEPLDKVSRPIPPDTPPRLGIRSDLSAETAKIKLMELENAWNKLVNEIHPTQSKEIENLELTAKNFHDMSVKYYNAGNYKLSIIYSHLSLEIIHAIEEIRR